MPSDDPVFSQGEMDSRCAKLESFGLVSRTERNVNVLASDPTPYALLQTGLDFVDYIKSAEEKNSDVAKAG